MKLLITGICGFAGSTLACGLSDSSEGLTICGLDNLSRPGSEANRTRLRERGIEVIHGDIRIGSDFDALPAVDWVIDAAANPSVLAGRDGRTSSLQLIENNLFGTVNILEFCGRHKAGFILLSSSRVYSIKPLAGLELGVCGNSFCLKKDTPLPAGLTSLGISEAFSTVPPVSLYGSAKLAAETLALEYGEMFDFPVRINRCGVLAGAGQFGRPDQGIIAYWINAYLHRRRMRYTGYGGSGYQVRDVLHPRDLVPLLMQQMSGAEHPARPGVINLGGGLSHAISLAQLTEWCRGRFGPHEVGRDPQARPFDVPWLVMDYSLAREGWGWSPHTSLQDILEEIADHGHKNPHWLQISDAM